MTIPTTPKKGNRSSIDPVSPETKIQPKKEGGGEKPVPSEKEEYGAQESAVDAQDELSIPDPSGLAKKYGWEEEGEESDGKDPDKQPVESTRKFSMTIQRIGRNKRVVEAIFNDGPAVPVTVWCKDASKLKVGMKIEVLKDSASELTISNEKALQRRAR